MRFRRRSQRTYKKGEEIRFRQGTFFAPLSGVVSPTLTSWFAAARAVNNNPSVSLHLFFSQNFMIDPRIMWGENLIARRRVCPPRVMADRLEKKRPTSARNSTTNPETHSFWFLSFLRNRQTLLVRIIYFFTVVEIAWNFCWWWQYNRRNSLMFRVFKRLVAGSKCRTYNWCFLFSSFDSWKLHQNLNCIY